MVAVGFLTFRGTPVIEWFLARWSFVLYAVYIVFFVLCFKRFGGDILSGFRIGDELGLGWVGGGVRYAAYNLAVIPPILFVIRHADSRRDAVTAGLLAGPIAIIPGLLFYVSVVSQYPGVLDRPVPANFMLEILGSRAFQLTFQLVLFGTLIETGTGMIHGVNERIARVFEEKQLTMPARLRPAVAVGLLVVGAVVARFGIIDLIAKGYGTISWFFVAVYAVPILTVGLWMMWRLPSGRGDASRAPSRAMSP